MLLGTDIDWKQYAKRLWQASQRFRPVRILDYVIASNHVHLLTWVPRTGDLSDRMKWLQGAYAGDCHRRLGREGAFWRGRFHPTLVETGSHLSRCLFYLDLNMVRAGAVDHPREWRFGGYHELAGHRKRYRIVDLDLLLSLLPSPNLTAFRCWYERTLTQLCLQDKLPREPHWSGTFAIGSRRWLAELTDGDPRVDEYVRPLEGSPGAGDQEATCVLTPPHSACRRIWTSRVAGKYR
jgi:putative transposase